MILSKSLLSVLFVIAMLIAINILAKLFVNFEKIIDSLRRFIVFLIKTILVLFKVLIKIVFFPITLFLMIKRYRSLLDLIVNNSKEKDPKDVFSVI